MGSDIAAAELALERLFRLTSNRTVHAKQTAAVGVDVTRAGYAVLRTVDQAGELPMGEIARQCSMDPATAARQVKALEDDGLVDRATHGDDARVTVVSLTPAGKDVYHRIVAVRQAHMREVLAGWTAQERADLARLVDRLVDDLRTTPIRPDRTKGA